MISCTRPIQPRLTAAVALVVGLATRAPVVAQQHDHPASPEKLGQVSFPTSCTPAVVPGFERAVAMLHSFWFSEAESAFREVAARDPACAMARWGIAMTLLGNPMTRVAPSGDAMRAGLAAAEEARALARSQSHREQMYADAVVAYYAGEGREHAARMKAHEEALASLSRAHPEDAEAAIFYARAMVANAPPADLTFSRQLAGAELLQPLFDRNPNHPGLAHYLIHAYDAPSLAMRGRSAALKYAGIAPSAPHALHMPSHIFTRLGDWEESIETNARSARAEPDSNAAVHPMDYVVYAYLQLGRDAAAGEVVRRAVQNSDRFYGGLIGYNFTAMPARYALERNAWAEAAQLRLPVGAAPYVEAITRFARGLGAARSGRADAAQAELEALVRLEAALRQQNDSYWATLVGAQRLAVQSWVARGRGEVALAVSLARQAAALEETVEKHPVTPGPILPARELEGDLLLELNRPAEALRSYEQTLAREPNRARALFGAARAAERAGKTAAARASYTELTRLMRGADPERSELKEARRFLAKP
ncbi:MAG: tetratricopeptide repeat protein [Gemmatimonadetes bacterium]|nr:tetratricopeptide repeat protein [Gemmatimonadota bacterium]